MTVLGELRDPWSVLLAVSAGAAVAWFTPWPVAVAVVLAVLVARVVAGRLWPAGTATLTLEDFDRGPGGKLTPKELEVAALIAQHLSNKEIAARLFVAEKTVGTHLDHIYTKLDINRRSQLVEWWKRREALIAGKKSGIA